MAGRTARIVAQSPITSKAELRQIRPITDYLARPALADCFKMPATLNWVIKMQLNRITLTGSDCVDFLHRQLTADIAALTEGEQVLTAWCNIQGRVLSLIWVKRRCDGLILEIPLSNYDKLMPRLRMFVLRDDVQFSEPELICGKLTPDAQLCETSEAEIDPKSDLIEAGIPYLESNACEQYLPQMLNLDLLGGLSFKKGCYPGQEIVARTHFRGKLKQRLLRLKSRAQTGEDIYNDQGAKAGSFVVTDGAQGLAVVRLEQLANGLFDSNGEVIEILPLPYAVPELDSKSEK